MKYRQKYEKSRGLIPLLHIFLNELIGDPYKKRTCLWLKNLPCLEPDFTVAAPAALYIDKNGKKRNWVEAVKCSRSERQKIRSKTFPGIARAMAYQFTNNFYVAAQIT